MSNIENSAQKLLESYGVEIASTALETKREFVLNWSVGLTVLLIALFIVGSIFCGLLVFNLIKKNLEPSPRLTTFCAASAFLCLLFFGAFLNSIHIKKIPTGEILYSIIANEQTNMVELQHNFDIVKNIEVAENATHRIFTVRIKDEPAPSLK